MSTLDFSENGDRKKRSNDNSKLKKFDPKLAFDLADQMKDLDEEFIRKIRSGMYTTNTGTINKEQYFFTSFFSTT